MGHQKNNTLTGQSLPASTASRKGEVLGSACSYACICALALSATAFAEGDKHIDDVNVRLDYGLPVHKSGTVDSMDFGSAYGGGVQTFVGKGKSLGLGVRYDVSSTEFSQVDGTMNTQWTDFTVGYRVWMLYPYVMLGSGALDADLDGVTLIDAIGITRGGGLGGRIAAGARAVGYFDLRYAQVAEAREATGQDVVIGPRIDFDVGLSIGIPIPGTEIVTGYRYRSYDVEIDGTGAAELETGPYIGFDVGFVP